MKTKIYFLILFAVLTCSNIIQAQVTGSFKNVSMSFTDGGEKIKASGGSGYLINEKGDTIAEGDLFDINELLVIRAKTNSSFTHAPNKKSFGLNSFPINTPKELAIIEYSTGNKWSMKDSNFLFILEIPNLNTPQLIPMFDKSLARASIITFPKGTYNLWGYTIIIQKPKGSVTFKNGKITNVSDATYSKI